jgi:hypothetical protein
MFSGFQKFYPITRIVGNIDIRLRLMLVENLTGGGKVVKKNLCQQSRFGGRLFSVVCTQGRIRKP